MKIEVVMIAAGLALTGVLIALEPPGVSAADLKAAEPVVVVVRGQELGGRVQPYVPSSAGAAGPTADANGVGPTRAKSSGPKVGADGTLFLTFEDLASYTYEHPDPKAIKEGVERPQQIPAEILALKGKTVIVEGHMVPVSVKKGKVTLFVLSRYLEGCCFGQPAMMNEWVDVEMQGEGAEYIPYGTILCTGVLDVGEQLDEYGYVRSIYRLKCTKVEEGKK
ncbi:MAG: DUF3299 domain-containing protein [Planctomycetes bacterium]|nr:DUF3299 domain-containing protein [Planctomycetota bacterium]